MSEWFERARKKLFEPNFRRPESPLEQRVKEVRDRTLIERCMNCPEIVKCNKPPSACDR